MNKIYKVTIKKGWASYDQKVYKTFYFGNSENACDFIERVDNAQHSYNPKHFRINNKYNRCGKISMEQILNPSKELKKKAITYFTPYAKLILDEGLMEYQPRSDFAKFINRLIERKSTPIRFTKNKQDLLTRVWFSDVKERNYPRSAIFLDKEQKQKILESV